MELLPLMLYDTGTLANVIQQTLLYVFLWMFDRACARRALCLLAKVQRRENVTLSVECPLLATCLTFLIYCFFQRTNVPVVFGFALVWNSTTLLSTDVC